MRIPWFKAVVYNILHINRTDGKKMAYLYLKRPAFTNELEVEIESEQKFMIIVNPDKMPMLDNLTEGDKINILVHLNSKVVYNKLGNEHILKSMQLCKLNIIE